MSAKIIDFKRPHKVEPSPPPPRDITGTRVFTFDGGLFRDCVAIVLPYARSWLLTDPADVGVGRLAGRASCLSNWPLPDVIHFGHLLEGYAAERARREGGR